MRQVWGNIKSNRNRRGKNMNMNMNNYVDVNLRDRDYCLEMEAGFFKAYEEKVLASGLCDFALPMQFTCRDNMQKVYYDCSGYTVVSEMKFDTVKELLEILEKTLLTFNKAKEFLIDQNKVGLHINTVYFHRKYRDVKIAYIPEEEKSKTTKIMEYIDELGKYVDEQCRDYLKRVKMAVINENLNLKDTINLIGKLRRVVYECGIR